MTCLRPCLWTHPFTCIHANFFFCQNFFFSFVKKYFCHKIESTDGLKCVFGLCEGGVHSCQYQGLVGPKGSECCSVLMRMVDNGTDWTLQRKLPVHVDKLPCGRQAICHCMPHTSHYSLPSSLLHTPTLPPSPPAITNPPHGDSTLALHTPPRSP